MFVELSLKCVYPTMIGEKFQIYVVQITGKCICQSNIYHAFPGKNSLPGSYHHPTGRGKLLIFQALFF